LEFSRCWLGTQLTANLSICRGKLLDRDSVCKILREDISPTIQLVGCNEKLPSTPLSTKVVDFVDRTWIWIVSMFHALMSSQIMKGLKFFVDRFIIPSISLIWAFFSTMWPSNDPALNQPNPTPQGGEGAEEIRIVRRIDTAGQRRCRSVCVRKSAHVHQADCVRWQGRHRHGDHRSGSAAVILFCTRSISNAWLLWMDQQCQGSGSVGSVTGWRRTLRGVPRLALKGTWSVLRAARSL
jgi:hypothetical protein